MDLFSGKAGNDIELRQEQQQEWNCTSAHAIKVKFMILKRKPTIKPISNKIKEVTFTSVLPISSGKCQ